MTSIRSFIASTGASGSLLVAAFIASVAVTTFLAFEGLPGGNGDGDAQVVALDQPDASTATAARAAGAAVGAAPSAVAASPAPVAGTEGTVIASAGGAAGSVPSSGENPSGPAGPPPRDRGGTSSTAPRCTDGSSPPCDPLEDLIGDGEGTTDDILGVRPGISEATRPVRDSVNGVLEETTGNTLGGHIRDVLGRE